MSRGFYTLASGMITQQRKIDVSSNNVANLNTAGYKGAGHNFKFRQLTDK